MIIDASVWIASVLQDEPRHRDCLVFLHRLVLEQRIATVPLLAWAEIAGALARRCQDAALGRKVVDTIAAKTWVNGVAIDQTLANEAARLAAELRLRGADAVYVALAALRREPLVSLDDEMIERAAPAVDALTPRLWLARR